MSVENSNQCKVLEEELFKSISKTHDVFAFFKYFGIDVLLYGSVFVLGKRKKSPLWMVPPLVVLVIKDVLYDIWERRKFDRVVEALRDEKRPLVLTNPSKLPPWVFHPDIERCTWLTKLLKQFWPFITLTLEEKIKNQIEPISGLKINHLSLGTLPPTVSGVKVYDKEVSDNSLIVDANLCYSGDSDFSFSYMGIPVGLKNFQLHGMARLHVLFVPKLPFVRGVEFSFLDCPKIDFSLTGIGSLGFTEEIVHKVVDETVLSEFVFPKKFSQLWDKEVRDVQYPEGVIRVNVVEAKNLEHKDYSNSFPKKKNLSGPYAEVSYGSRTFRSEVINSNLNPHWDMWCEFVQDSEKEITIKILDKNVSSDVLIGTSYLNVADVKKQGRRDSWSVMVGSKGSVHVVTHYLEVSSNLKLVKFPPPDFSFLSSYVLTVVVHSAHNLSSLRSQRTPSSSVQLTVGNDIQETKVVENSVSPMFGEIFNFFVNDPDFNRLTVKVLSDEGKTEIGTLSYNINKLLDHKDLKIEDQRFPLIDSPSDSSLFASMKLGVISNVFPDDGFATS